MRIMAQFFLSLLALPAFVLTQYIIWHCCTVCTTLSELTMLLMTRGPFQGDLGHLCGLHRCLLLLLEQQCVMGPYADGQLSPLNAEAVNRQLRTAEA